MKLRKYIDEIKPQFEPGGKFSALQSLFDGFETFLYVPNTTRKSGVSIHDSIDSKRIMSMVVIALIPALLFGMYNVGSLYYTSIGQDYTMWCALGYGFLKVLPLKTKNY